MRKRNLLFSLISSIVLVFTIMLLAGCGGTKTKNVTKAKTNANTNAKTTASNVTTKKNDNNNNNEHLLSTARTIRVVKVEGTASVYDGEETTACYKGMYLYDGDTLTVAANSTLIVKFDEDKYVYLGGDTIVNIKSSGKDKYKTNVFVTKGVVLAEIQNKLNEDEEFFLSSNNSVMAVRGTIFGLDVEEKGEDYVQTYAVYKGVTELFVFDKKEGNIVSGKITDISNAKYELTIPKTHLLTTDEMNTTVGEWLDKATSTFSDATDANDQLYEVEITVSKPTKNDFDEVLNIVEESNNNNPVNYSDIEYTSKGYFGEYDGAPHKIEVTPITTGATVTYRAEGETEYKATNDYEYYAPGTYRVYYKIECDGLDTKEDFEVIYITKPNIIIDSDALTYDNISKMSVLNLAPLTATDDFNKYNGIKAETALNNVKYYIGNDEIEANNITVNYKKIMNGYIELVDGINTLNVTFEFDNHSFTTDVNFLFSDTREDTGYLVGVSSNDLQNLSGNLYYFNSTPFVSSEIYYTMDSNDFLTAFGLDVMDLTTMLINYPAEVMGSDVSNYDGTNSLTLEGNKFVEVNFLVFPNNTTKGYSDTVYVYIADSEPESNSYPSFTTTKTTYSYNPEKNSNGVKMNFINSDSTVTYSLDGSNYSADLYLTESGIQKVYYKVEGSDESFDVLGYEFINVIAGEGVITFDNLKFITTPVHILSNDNNYDLSWVYVPDGGYQRNGDVIADDINKTITSLDDAYTIYSNMIKNAVFYDSITNEILDATVTIKEKSENSANFNYTVEVEGYETLTGTVRFDNSKFGTIINIDDSDYEEHITVTLPNDYEISLSEVAQAIPSRIYTSIEGLFINYQTYYSVDNGKTWTTSIPKITTVGEHEVYVLPLSTE